MKKVFLYSLLLVGGLMGSQFLAGAFETPIRLLTMAALAFLMIHVGYEFEIDKRDPKKYLWDYAVAGTAAAFPWLFCALYFVWVLAPGELHGHVDQWKESLLLARFASPTSAGVLFSMLAAAGLSATWLFKKARVLAIFDDLDTVLLMIPLKALMVGMRWQLAAIVLVIVGLLGIAWRWLHSVRLPVSWPWILAYSAGITVFCEILYLGSLTIDSSVPLHLEVLLPAFVVGCVLARPAGHDPHGQVSRSDDAREGHQEGPAGAAEQRVATAVSAIFMVLVGLSMPPLAGAPPAPPGAAKVTSAPADSWELFPPALAADAPTPQKPALAYDGVPAEVLAAKDAFPGWGMIAVHVLVITLLSNLGKMFPTFCYRREATLRERFALSLGMCPRGEVGAGVLVVALSYGLGGPALTIAVLSLALNLLLTGPLIVVVKRLLGPATPGHATGQSTP